MNNDADQKIKWRKWTIFGGDLDYPRISGPSIAYAENIKVIEAAPALAEIESLRAENAELKEQAESRAVCPACGEEVSADQKIMMAHDVMKYETKLTAATAQMEKMAGRNVELFYARQALAQYEQFKKEATRE